MVTVYLFQYPEPQRITVGVALEEEVLDMEVAAAVAQVRQD